MLSMLRITGDAPAVVMLNGQTAGLLEQGEMEQTIGGGRTLLQLFPLSGDRLPVTAVLEQGDPPALTGPEGVLSLYLLSERHMHLQAAFPRVERISPAMPYILRRASWEQNGLQATVYFDRLFSFAIERGGRILLSGAFDQWLTDARITRRRDVLLIEGFREDGAEFFAIALSPEPRVLLHEPAQSAAFREDLLEYTQNLGEVMVEVRYSLGEKKPLSRRMHLAPGEDPDLLRALLTAVRQNEEEFAMSLIAPALKKDASFGDFQAFLGDYAGDYGPLRQKNEAALCYALSKNVFSVRRLRAAVKCEQIWNIEEI